MYVSVTSGLLKKKDTTGRFSSLGLRRPDSRVSLWCRSRHLNGLVYLPPEGFDVRFTTNMTFILSVFVERLLDDSVDPTEHPCLHPIPPDPTDPHDSRREDHFEPSTLSIL